MKRIFVDSIFAHNFDVLSLFGAFTIRGGEILFNRIMTSDPLKRDIISVCLRTELSLGGGVGRRASVCGHVDVRRL